MAKQKKSPTVSAVREAPVEDPKRAPYTPDNAKLRRADRGQEQPNEEAPKKDHVYGIASRQRWGGDADIAELHRDSRAVEGQHIPDGGEEEEEENDASNLTVAQLKEALEAAEVEVPAGAKKADLVALYEEHNLGDAE